MIIDGMCCINCLGFLPPSLFPTQLTQSSPEVGARVGVGVGLGPPGVIRMSEQSRNTSATGDTVQAVGHELKGPTPEMGLRRTE